MIEKTQTIFQRLHISVILIRREQERGEEIEVVRAALIEGEKSGKPKRFDAGAFKRKLRRAHG